MPFSNFTLTTSPYLKLSHGVTVCDDGWDFAETNVVCRELHLGKADTSASLGRIPKGTDKMWLDDMFCVGAEKSLLDCRHRPWGQSNCQHSKDTVLYLRCTGPGVRTCKAKCPGGFFPKGNTCQQCNFTCSTYRDSANECLTCAEGFFKKNDTCVKNCGIGYYLDTVCKPCKSRCADCEVKADNCISCAPPLFRKGKDCVENCTRWF